MPEKMIEHVVEQLVKVVKYLRTLNAELQLLEERVTRLEASTPKISVIQNDPMYNGQRTMFIEGPCACVCEECRKVPHGTCKQGVPCGIVR